ncbi:MAG TPA: UrcA family protein [Steroidobacteraceae bacterium]|jgi:UrcA family protein|nr:UrcA family protein [Steroidobacteraceae bacterium]
MISLRLSTAFAISSCVLASVLVIPPGVCAESPGQLPTKLVRFADLNLHDRDGVELLYRRIQGAARDVCGPSERTGSRIRSAAWQACMANAVKTAVQRVDRPMLTAYYDEHHGQRIQRGLTRTAASNN